MSDIPLEHWPRCRWCGEFLGEMSLEVKTWGDQKRCICDECTQIIKVMIMEFAPYYLGKFLSHYGDLGETLVGFPNHRYLAPEDVEKMARANMEKS